MSRKPAQQPRVFILLTPGTEIWFDPQSGEIDSRLVSGADAADAGVKEREKARREKKPD